MDFTRCFSIIIRLNFDFDFDLSNLINLLGIITNVFIAIYIVKKVQESSINKRSIKDYFINEICDIENEYKKFYNSLLKGQVKPQKVLEWFKALNIRTDSITTTLSRKYDIDCNSLKNYRSNLLNLVTESSCYEENYNEPFFEPSDDLKYQIFVYMQRNNTVFKDLVILINDI